MCGRYVSPAEAAIVRAIEIQRHSWSSRLRSQGLFGMRYNVSPTDPVPVVRVVRELDGEREGTHLRWGLIPHWARGKAMGNTINARIETLRTNASFRDAWQRGQRCLVALSGFYEWQAQPPDWQVAVPYYITVVDQDPFFLAGLWDRSVTPAGEMIESCTVITMPANELMADIHNSKKTAGKRVLLAQEERRMPAILAREDHQTWLSGAPEEAFKVLKQFPSGEMFAYPVSNRVNSNRNDGPDLIQPRGEEGGQSDLFS
ncbi:SOS response-associated peptidase [Peristeroidobacter soli]|uniref:SOS response-associated peptidase n=1 Tax=Peristeroidobacter soli TaxID=2497877 RepID=UPI00101D7F76|nr:SOS response-associated peptidase [Peristeroidobacter soli]